MKRKPTHDVTPLACRVTPLALAVTLLVHLGSSLAQESALESQRAAEVQQERERTRANIEQFTGEQSSSIDVAPTFGRELPAELKSLTQPSRPYAHALEPDKPGAPATSSALLKEQLPPVAPSGVKKWIRSPAKKSQADASDRPVFTPDFSRQTLTFAALAKRPVVALPQQEVGAESASLETDRREDKLLQDALSLPDLVRMGLEYSLVMEQVQAQLDTMVSRAKQSRAQLLPRMSLRVAKGQEKSSVQNGTAIEDHTTRNQSARLTQPLVDVASTYDWLGSLSTQEAAQWRMQAGRETVSLAVTQAVVSLASAKLILDFSDEQLQQFNALLSYVEARADAGASSQADLERTRTRVLAAKQLRIDQQAQYRNAQLELERLTGLAPSALRLPYLNQLPGLPKTLTEIRQLARESSHDLQALRADVQAQSNTQRAESGRMLPVLGISLEHDQSENVRGINAQQTDRRAMAVMTWDFSLGGKEIFAAKGAASELNNRRAKLDEETQRMLQGVDADFALLQSASLRVVAGQAEQNAAIVVVEALRAQLKSGRLGSVIEALDAVDRHFAARQRLVQTLAQQMQAQAQLLKRIGMLSQLQAHAETLREKGDEPTSVSDAPGVQSNKPGE